MYQLLLDIVNFDGAVNTTLQNSLIYACTAIIIIGFVVLLDLLYRIFRHFWR